jgi:hypothetical protein
MFYDLASIYLLPWFDAYNHVDHAYGFWMNICDAMMLLLIFSYDNVMIQLIFRIKLTWKLSKFLTATLLTRASFIYIHRLRHLHGGLRHQINCLYYLTNKTSHFHVSTRYSIYPAEAHMHTPSLMHFKCTRFHSFISSIIHFLFIWNLAIYIIYIYFIIEYCIYYR